MDDDEVPQRVEQRLDQAEDVYERHGKIFRTMWILVGVVVVIAGLAMTVVPGPVTVVVPAGLIMLAAVFGWARRLLLQTVDKGLAAKHLVEDQSKKAKVLEVVAIVCLAAAAVAVGVAWFL